jgi:hypothetical protein
MPGSHSSPALPARRRVRPALPCRERSPDGGVNRVWIQGAAHRAARFTLAGPPERVKDAGNEEAKPQKHFHPARPRSDRDWVDRAKAVVADVSRSIHGPDVTKTSPEPKENVTKIQSKCYRRVTGSTWAPTASRVQSPGRLLGWSGVNRGDATSPIRPTTPCSCRLV